MSIQNRKNDTEIRGFFVVIAYISGNGTMNLMEYLRNDAELKQLREEWKKKSGSSFPPYNYDEYTGIDDYKQKIRKELEKINKN